MTSSFFAAVFLHIPTIPSGCDVTIKQQKMPFWIFTASNKDVKLVKVSVYISQASCLLVQYPQY